MINVSLFPLDLTQSAVLESGEMAKPKLPSVIKEGSNR
jgi:hypothetical protein